MNEPQHLETRDRTIAYTFTRVLLGFIFFFQGFGKVFKWGVENVYQNFFLPDYQEILPSFILQFTAYFTSYTELIGGGLLIIGLKTRWALYLLGVVLLVVSIGHGIKEPIWDLQHVMYRVLLLLFLLWCPRKWDRWSMDTFIGDKTN
jgi:uncharacterized membrane protein YphA (DoxX/SURF4 family)